MVVIEHDANGYSATCPALQGCYAQGSTHKEAVENIRDAISLHIADRLAQGEEIPTPSELSIETLEISA